MKKILLIDDDFGFRSLLKLYLKDDNYTFIECQDGLSGLEAFIKERPYLVISDFVLPDLNGIQVLKEMKTIDPDIQVIILTAFDDINNTISAIQLGAFDCLDKITDLSRLTRTISVAFESKRITSSLIPVESQEDNSGNAIVGKNPMMKEIYKKIGYVSSNKVTVLLQGESGTGKELVARKIHNSGITKGQPFIAVNCTALTESLLESELFGHVKGAYTGAIKEKKGKFELAGDGTIFLDEISEISLSLQVKLLRILQEKEYEKVGGEYSQPLNARIIAATNVDLIRLVGQGRFRSDLYYRLKVFTIEIPPLRQRKEDIPRLVIYFINKINKELNKNVTKVPYEVMDYLQNCTWTGNVRELENTLTQAVLLAKGNVLEKEYLTVQEKTASSAESNDCTFSLAEMEKRYITNVLSSHNWNKQQACRILKISKTTLYSKIKSYKIEEQIEN
ncbi:MAG: sigma-54-dependent transcriptional regulator [Bacillota bacterium]